MFVATTFDPSIATSGQFNVGLPVGGHFITYNESIFGINLTFSNGDKCYVPAWSADVFTQPEASPLINWQQSNALNSSSPPISMVTVVSYLPNEKITGFFPIALTRQQNVGNVVTFSQGSVLNVINDGNPSGTNVVEATVAGSPGSNVLIQNQGLIEVLQWTGGVLTQIFKTNPGGASVVLIGNTGLLAEVLGSLKVDQNFTITGSITTSNGTGRFFYPLSTPFHMFTNPTLNSGNTRTDTYTGGSTGIPSAAVAIVAGIGIIPAASTGYVQIAPHGGTLGDYVNFSSVVAGQYSTGMVIIPLDVNGQADVKAIGANIVLQDWWLYGYFI